MKGLHRHRERDQLVREKRDLREALQELVNIIDAAGVMNLSNGVQLGATVWYVKASEHMDYAKMILSEAKS